MKKQRLILILLLDLLTPISINAQAESVQAPYQLITQIQDEPIDQVTCQSLIQNQYQEGSGPNQTHQIILDYQEEIIALEEEYQHLIERIESLENDPEYSLQQATAGLNQAIETLYQAMVQDNPEFSERSAEEQLAHIKAEPVVQEWQTYLETIKNEQNEAISQKAVLETRYQELIYLIETSQNELANQQLADQQLNQCLIYAYSVPRITSESLLMDNHLSSLTEYLSVVDGYLNQLVPYPYQQLRFEDIYQAYQKLKTPEEIIEQLNLKGNVELDSTLIDKYQYQEELSLYEVAAWVSVAQNKWYQEADSNQYVADYQQMLLIKEAQFLYFSQINSAAWQFIKDKLAQFLNLQAYISPEAIEQVRQLHEKYQVKLVTFDENSGQWTPVDTMSTGYLDSYYYQIFDLENQFNSVAEGSNSIEDDSESNEIEVELTSPGDGMEEEEITVESEEAMNSNVETTELTNEAMPESFSETTEGLNTDWQDDKGLSENNSNDINELPLPKPISGTRYSSYQRSQNTNEDIPDDASDNLDYLKTKLARQSQSTTNKQNESQNNKSTKEKNETNSQELNQLKAKDKTKIESKSKTNTPTKTADTDKNKESATSSKTKSKNNSNQKVASKQSVQLPTTGEKQRATLLALTVLLIGAMILLTTVILKRKRREELDKIDLN